MRFGARTSAHCCVLRKFAGQAPSFAHCVVALMAVVPMCCVFDVQQATNNTLGINHGFASVSDNAFLALETNSDDTAYFLANDPRCVAHGVAAVLCCAVLCCAVLCCAVLCCAVLCCAV